MWFIIGVAAVAGVIYFGGNNTGDGFGEDLERTGERIQGERY